MATTLEIKFEAPTQDLAQEVGLMVLDAIFKKLSGSRSGRWYPIPGNSFYDRLTPKDKRADNYHVKFSGALNRTEVKGGAYQASAPGEAPAVRTGRLRQSFYMTVSPGFDGRYIVSIKTNVIYADDLEYGNERIDARPFAGPAVDEITPEIISKFNNFSYNRLRYGE